MCSLGGSASYVGVVNMALCRKEVDSLLSLLQVSEEVRKHAKLLGGFQLPLFGIDLVEG